MEAGSWDAAAHYWAAYVRSGADKPYEWNAPAFLDLLPPPSRLTVDVGCGEGRLARELKGRGYDVVGFDSSKTLVELAREADSEGDYRVADAARLPLEEGAAALVVAFLVLQEIPHMREAVREAARVLAEGGRFCLANVHPIATAGDFSADSDDFVLSNYCRCFERQRPIGASTITHFHRPVAEYVSALADAGFLVETIRELPTMRRARGKIPAYVHICAVKTSVG